MTENKPSTPVDWIDPDDAPELTDHFFDHAEVRVGERVVRSATATMAQRVGVIQPAAKAAAPPLRPTETQSPPPSADRGRVLEELREVIDRPIAPPEAIAPAGDGSSPQLTALRQELATADSDEALRQWAQRTAPLRSSLPPQERSLLRSEVAAIQSRLDAEDEERSPPEEPQRDEQGQGWR